MARTTEELKYLGAILDAIRGENAKFPKFYDYMAVTSVNGNNDPLTIEFRVGGSGGILVFTHTLTYDASGDFETLTITV